VADRANTPGRRFRTAVAAALGAMLVRALGATWRVRWVGDELPSTAAVLAMWHGELLPLVWALRGRGIAPLVSTHADGEVITRIIQSLGYSAIRGSTSRGGARALIEATRRLDAGTVVAFTTDGPRGPRRRSAAGALAAAQRSGVDVIPMGAATSRAWRLGSWDRFVIPKPFATIAVRRGPSLRDVSPGDLARLDTAILEVCEPDPPDA
jgi:lysophospholipid acyltransferase (LPLAT)-like uncharacterized protein